MYDRATDTYWPQILATGVHGPLKDQYLEEIRVVWTTWGNWKARYPATEVLSQRTGYARNYRQDPYGSYNPRKGYYAERSPPIMPVMNESRRNSRPKQEIFGFRTRTEAVAVDKKALARERIMRFQGEEHDFLIIHDAGLETAWVLRGDHNQLPENIDIGDITFGPDGPAGEGLDGLAAVNGFEAFWFAWYAFFPKTVMLR